MVKVNQKIESFIQTLHSIWLADALDMDAYMDVQWTLMLRQGINYKSEMDLHPDAIVRLSQLRLSVEELFSFDCNCYAYDNYQTFHSLCIALMDFSKMQEGRVAS